MWVQLHTHNHIGAGWLLFQKGNNIKIVPWGKMLRTFFFCISTSLQQLCLVTTDKKNMQSELFLLSFLKGWEPAQHPTKT